MPQEKEIRKLAAILHADVKGYSRLMGEDESYTVRCLGECRRIFAETIGSHGGRVVNAPGDSILAEFPSVVSAVQCAVEIQGRLKERNADLPDNRKMEFRIGVNLGDVIESEDAIYGDGVNIAARLEALAEAGGIAISRTVFSHIQNKLKYGYEDQGEHRVKNIEKPVRVYKLLTSPENEGKVILRPKRQPFTSGGSYLALTAALYILATFAILLYYPASPPIEPASVEKMAYPLPDKPSIAVLPFNNMSGDPEQEYIADGLTENIISALSRIPGMFVIARNSSFAYKNKPVKVQQVAEELGVRYVLEGSVQKSGSKLRIIAQLINATKGHHLWSETYDREFKDLFELQDEITKEIVVALQVKLTEGEQAKIRHRSTDNLRAWEKAVRGYSLFEHYNKEDNAKARGLFEEAVKFDPDYAWAWTWLAWTHWVDARFQFSEDRVESFRQSVQIAQKAVALDNNDPDVYGLLGGVNLYQRRHDEAIAAGKKAIALGPSNAEVHALLAMTLLHSTKFEEAVVVAKKALRLSPHYPSWYLVTLGAPNYFLGLYEEAIEALEASLRRSKDEKDLAIQILSHLYLASTYIELGREEEASKHVEDILAINPRFSLEWPRKANFQRDPGQRKRWMDALRKAGVPEG